MSGFGTAGPPPASSITGWTHLRTGKVRDLYVNDKKEILLVASDRVSAFDWVLPTVIPGKGEILTQLSLFWFELLADIVPNHIISVDVPKSVEDRAVIVQPLEMFDIECVARGYLTGSGWAEYKINQAVCGNELPAGLTNGSQLPMSIFTPATKAKIGDHDINIDFDQAVEIVCLELTRELKDLTIKLFETASEFTAPRDLILADAKFGRGLPCRPWHERLGGRAGLPSKWGRSTLDFGRYLSGAITYAPDETLKLRRSQYGSRPCKSKANQSRTRFEIQRARHGSRSFS